jgi:hypothetical protein
LEGERHGAQPQRPTGSAAIPSSLLADVAALHVVEQALGVLMKRFERPMLGFLPAEEVLAVIGSPAWLDQSA